jgi:hypothetical protein
MNAKRKLKTCVILSELRKKSDFDPPFWIGTGNVADKNTNAL